jgi:uncharacterized membrane protein YtjA (UPF0391 family)
MPRKSRDFKSRCEEVLNEIASIGGGILAGRAAGKAKVLCKMVAVVFIIHRVSFVGGPC